MATEYEGCECIHDTGSAILVIIPELTGHETKAEFKDTGKFWIPQVAVHDDSEVYEAGDEGTLIVKDWFAEKELG